MGIDVSICVSSPLVYWYLTSLLSLSILLYFSCLSPSIRVNHSNISVHTSLLVASPHLTPGPFLALLLSLPPHFPLVFSTALVGTDVWCGACGGGRGEGIEPQSGNRCEATQLHVTSDLATRDQSYELPAHGKCRINATCFVKSPADIHAHSPVHAFAKMRENK